MTARFDMFWSGQFMGSVFGTSRITDEDIIDAMAALGVPRTEATVTSRRITICTKKKLRSNVAALLKMRATK